MKILVVDDEIFLAHTIAQMLGNMGYHQVEIESDFDKARCIIANKNTTLALLDINLGKGKEEEGIALAALCAEYKIPFVYISSYSDKATLDKALQHQPSAYLIKPISEGNLYTTLQIISRQQDEQAKHMLQFKDGTELINLPISQVYYLKAENIYVNIVTQSKTYLYRGSLASLIDKVPTGTLIQTHRSYAVNPDHIERIAASYMLIHGVEIPISRNFKNVLPKS